MATTAKSKATKKETAVATNAPVGVNAQLPKVPSAEQVKALNESAQDLYDGKANVHHFKAQGEVSKSKDIFAGAADFPEHYTKIATIIKLNADIRRHVSLGILNYLRQRREINGKGYVSFKWNKFAVKYGNLTKEYSYAEVFFLNALAASFTSFANDAQISIDNFVEKEGVDFDGEQSA